MSSEKITGPLSMRTNKLIAHIIYTSVAFLFLPICVNANAQPTSPKVTTLPNGFKQIDITGNQVWKSPDGYTYSSDGTVTTPDGIRMKMISKDGRNVTGVQYYRSNGTKLKPGEKITTGNGVILKQEQI
jgi:hypothetical protein